LTHVVFQVSNTGQLDGKRKRRAAKAAKSRPENTAPDAPPRDTSGRWLAGGPSPNPGGIPKRALELRRLALEHAPEALARAIAMMSHYDAEVADIGITHVLNRALGRPSAPAELPEDEAPSTPVDTTPNGLLTLSMAALGRVLANLHGRADAGHPLSQAEVETLASAARTLSVLAKEERELQKAGPGAALSDEALVDAVLKALPLEKLRAALAEKERAA
jgi:hypothetical protein